MNSTFGVSWREREITIVRSNLLSKVRLLEEKAISPAALLQVGRRREQGQEN